MPSEFEKKIRTEDASGVVQMIKDAHTVRKVIEWPGVPSVKVQMRLLNASEARLSKVANQQEFKRDGIDIGVQNLADYREQEAIHGLWQVFSDPETGKPLFKSAEEMRTVCTNDEITALCNAYNAFADENDPNLDKLSDEDFDDLKELIKKKPDQIPQKVTSLPVALKLLRTLVAQQKN
ncbi:MAG: hypothetical protein MJY99_10415 [Fibrobacter sp.]|nr:hypothetical protein [Fibrobacter sp.]